jgi:hypothetical protein
MLKDAALLVVNLNVTLREYGLQTKDCHGFNIVFDHGKPRYVDLGSIVRLPQDSRSWLAEEEFVRYYVYGLRLWAGGDAEIVRAILENENRLMSHGTYLRFRHSLLRTIPTGTLHTWMRYYYKFKTVGLPETREVVRTRLPGAAGRVLLALSDRSLLPFQKSSLKAWGRELKALAPPETHSKWGNYQAEFIDSRGEVRPTPRLTRVVEILRDLQVQSMIEFGANQGALSRLTARELGLRQIVCTDYDDEAIDRLYRHLGGTDHAITPAVLDCMAPVITARTKEPSSRFRCEAAVALALTHHLVLTQRMSLARVFQAFRAFASKYLIVEFMPLGLWDGSNSPAPPPWYTVEWFARTLQDHCTILRQEELETNRILFVGEIRG